MDYAEFVVNIIAALNTFIFLTRSSLFSTGLHVAVRLFCIGSQMSSNCGKNKEVAHELQASVSLMFPHVLTSSV